MEKGKQEITSNLGIFSALKISNISFLKLFRYNSRNHKIHLGEAHKSVVLVYSQCIQPFPRSKFTIFTDPEILSPLVVTSYPRLLPVQAINNLHSISVDLPILDTSHNWNLTMCGLLRLASFIQRVFKVHSCRIRCLYFIPFLCQIMLHRMNSHILFMHSPTKGHLRCFHSWLL